jgi:hypothetical protein
VTPGTREVPRGGRQRRRCPGNGFSDNEPDFTGGAPFGGTNFGATQNGAGVTLDPGESCSFFYEFHPTTLGEKNTSTSIGIDRRPRPAD